MKEPQPHITLVTVTYGDRVRFLSELLDRALGEEKIAEAVVVSNGSLSDLSPLMVQWGARITLVELGTNTGSANGYAMGIETALNKGAEFLLLMDDDNAPSRGAAELLFQELAVLGQEVGRENAAVLGFREGRSTHIANKAFAFPPQSSFNGFHIADIPRKVWQRLGKAAVSTNSIDAAIDIPYSPYGGLLAHSEVFRRLGLPKRDLILYADDWEYTLRLTQSGGKIRLITSARIDDLEKSWFEGATRENIFTQSLLRGTDFRIFYAYRNHIWLNKNRQRSSRAVYWFNKWCFLVVLFCHALAYGKMSRFFLIWQAICDADRNILGVKPKFKLV